MTSPWRWLGLGIAVLGQSCCPSLWLTVTKGDIPPRQAIGVPAIATVPITLVATRQNRFDVLNRGARTIEEAAYSDAFEPGDGVVRSRARALRGFERLQSHSQGKPIDVLGDDAVCGEAKVTCRPYECRTLQLDGSMTLQHPVVLRVDDTEELRAVEAASPDQGGLIVRLASGIKSRRPDLENYSFTTQVCISEQFHVSRPLLSFVHLSDMQIRDGAVTLEGPNRSTRLGGLLPSFEHDDDLAAYNPYMAEAVIATINAQVDRGRERPVFVIHTGNAIDAGVMSELARFHDIVDQLEIPLFDLLGNHDALVFGNLVPTASTSDTTCATTASIAGADHWFAPDKLCVDQAVRCPTCVGTEAQLVARPEHERTRARFIGRLHHAGYEAVAQLPGPQEAYCTVPQIQDGDRIMVPEQTIYAGAASREHGFDLNVDADKHALGYYAFAEKLASGDRHALFIALDSEDLEDKRGGPRGRIGPIQMAWLQSVLGCVQRDPHKHDLIFVVAHQPLSEIEHDGNAASLVSVLEAAPNVIGFLYGHHHEHAICGDHRPGGPCSQFWEIETSSILEFPQEGRLIAIKQVSSDLAFLDVSAFGQHLADPGSDYGRVVALARRGAERDYCRSHPGARCSADLRPYRSDGRHADGRLFFRLP